MQSFNNLHSEFINKVSWSLVNTMPEWPHEFIVKKDVDDELFSEVVKHIRKFGYEGMFYKKAFTFFDFEGMVYWTMGEPVGATTTINRCKSENTYEVRLKNGTLPERY